MDNQLTFVRPSLYRTILDSISNPSLHYRSHSLEIPKFYDRGKYRFVYKIDKEVIKVFKVCSPFNSYFSRFYQESKERIHPHHCPDEHASLLQRMTWHTSLAITQFEAETYGEMKGNLPHRFVDTKFGIARKSRFNYGYYRPYTQQLFLEGPLLTTLETERKKIRSEPVDDSFESLYGTVLDFSQVDKDEVLNGIEEFTELFHRLYLEQGAVLDLNLRNLLYTDSDGLICFDIQKFHKKNWEIEDDLSPLDIYHILQGILEVNQ